MPVEAGRAASTTATSRKPTNEMLHSWLHGVQRGGAIRAAWDERLDAAVFTAV
jgi:hypothetical protein